MGAGAAGALTATQLLDEAARRGRPIEVLLIDPRATGRRKRPRGGAAAYRAHFSWHAALHELALDDAAALHRRYAAQLAPPTVQGARPGRLRVAAVAVVAGRAVAGQGADRGHPR